jgi:hypothetical protein
MMPLSFDFKFPGIGGEGICGITIGTAGGDDPEMRGYVIVCSQKRDYRGVSVTNALETIAAKLFKDLWTNQLEMTNAEGDEKMRFALLGTWIKKLKSKSNRSLGDIYKRNTAVWVEHYPAGTGITSDDSFMEVWFDPEGYPTWLSAQKASQAHRKFGAGVITAAISYSRKN